MEPADKRAFEQGWAMKQDRVAEFRARQKAKGLAELRGLYAPKRLHPAIKKIIKDLLADDNYRSVRDS